MKIAQITSPQNDRIKRIVRLRKSKGDRENEQSAVIEGFRVFSRALDASITINEVFFCPELFLGKNEETLLKRAESGGAILFRTTPEVFAKIAYRDRPEGLLGTIPTRKHLLDKIPLKKDATYLILEAIEKPGNIGAMLRSADAAGASGIIICGKRADIYNPNVISASTGIIFSIPIAEASHEETANWLAKNNIKRISTSPHAEKNYSDANLTGASAIIAGTEQHGLSEYWLKNCEICVRIPMLGKADSLNVAASVTILLYEIARQKKWLN